METLRNLCGAGCAIAFVTAATIAILYDLGVLYEDPEKARKRKERQKQAAVEQQEQSQRTAEATSRRRDRADGLAARAHLKHFYVTHRGLLGDACPPALIAAFIRSEMGDDLSGSQQWTVCLKKITELLPLVVRGRKERLRLSQIDAEIRACRQRIARMERLGQDDMLADEREGQILKLRQLETQRQMLIHANNGGAA